MQIYNSTKTLSHRTLELFEGCCGSTIVNNTWENIEHISENCSLKVIL